MPELPELEVVCEVLQRRALGRQVREVTLLPPGAAILVRDLTGKGFGAQLQGATFESVARRGKYLIFGLAGKGTPLFLVINPKLTGRLQLAAPADKRLPKTHAVFDLDNDTQLRYVDQKTMGQLYLTSDPALVPEFANMGPEPFALDANAFAARLKPFLGEIKGVLTRNECVAGIGNAYADEILWEARIHPYRKRPSLSAEEIARLHAAMLHTLRSATVKVREAMGEKIHLKPREFMAVHMKTGEPCPRCGSRIELVQANQRITNFCRTCQPGGLIRGM